MVAHWLGPNELLLLVSWVVIIGVKTSLPAGSVKWVSPDKNVKDKWEESITPNSPTLNGKGIANEHIRIKDSNINNWA